MILRSVGRPDLGYRAISWEIEMLPASFRSLLVHGKTQPTGSTAL